MSGEVIINDESSDFQRTYKTEDLKNFMLVVDSKRQVFADAALFFAEQKSMRQNKVPKIDVRQFFISSGLESVHADKFFDLLQTDEDYLPVDVLVDFLCRVVNI